MALVLRDFQGSGTKVMYDNGTWGTAGSGTAVETHIVLVSLTVAQVI